MALFTQDADGDLINLDMVREVRYSQAEGDESAEVVVVFSVLETGVLYRGKAKYAREYMTLLEHHLQINQKIILIKDPDDGSTGA
jgi:hypothetical protein